MKVVTATGETQGWRENDFCWTIEGELVYFVPFECGRGSIDDACGCRRSMGGLVSHLATTTIKIIERPEIDVQTYHKLIAEAHKSQGYVTDALMTKPAVRGWLQECAHELIALASHWPNGTVLERRGDFLFARR